MSNPLAGTEVEVERGDTTREARIGSVTVIGPGEGAAALHLPGERAQSVSLAQARRLARRAQEEDDG